MTDRPETTRSCSDLLFWIGVLLAGAVIAAVVWRGGSLIEASRAACEADGWHTQVRTYYGMACIEGRKVSP